MESTTAGHLLAFSSDKVGELVNAYAPDGKHLWAYRGDPGAMLRAHISASGNSSVVWSISPDRLSSVVHLLDAQGNELHELEVNAIRSAAYSGDESTLVLAGWDFVALVDTVTRRVTWSSTAQLSQPAGEVIHVSGDGRRVDLLMKPTDDTAPPELRTIVRARDATHVEDSRRKLEHTGHLGRVLGLERLDDGNLRLVTTVGQRRVQ